MHSEILNLLLPKVSSVRALTRAHILVLVAVVMFGSGTAAWRGVMAVNATLTGNECNFHWQVYTDFGVLTRMMVVASDRRMV